MILADKIIALRKQNGWSQEELARQLDVTRQAVSKWEGAQAVPDLERVLQLSRLFGVSVDSLLKDEMELPESGEPEETPDIRQVGMEEANAFLAAKDATALPVALGTLLCVLSPVCLLLMGAAAEAKRFPLSENAAAGIGMSVLLALVAAACGIFIATGAKTGRFDYLETDPITLKYGVAGMVRQRQQAFAPVYTRVNILATALCVMAAVPIFIGMCFGEQDLWMAGMVCLTLLLAGAGAFLFILVGIPWASMEKLLQEGDYTRAKKAGSRRRQAIGTVYWLAAVAVYLAWSFATDDWRRTWIVWPVAGVLFAAVMILTNLLFEKDDQAGA